jgi:hypothetical protein
MRVDAADTTIIRATTASDLVLPASSVPPTFTLRASEGQAMSVTSLRPLLGRHLTGIFAKNGWTAGYHGWLDANDLRGDGFATYDVYGFKANAGARAAAPAYLGLILGVRTPISDRRLPSNASVFIDGTGTYNPSGLPFTVVEIVFRVDNVVADVTGYNTGNSAADTDAARETATLATVSLASWLHAQSHPAKHASLPLPLLPLILLAPTIRRPGRRLGF